MAGSYTHLDDSSKEEVIKKIKKIVKDLEPDVQVEVVKKKSPVKIKEINTCCKDDEYGNCGCGEDNCHNTHHNHHEFHSNEEHCHCGHEHSHEHSHEDIEEKLSLIHIFKITPW